MRLGVLGGVFNPPHLGHLVCAQEAVLALDLDQVLFVPVGEAPHRSVELDPGPEVRHELCRAAVEGDDRLACSRIEVDRPGPSYTVDTLRALRKERGGEDELVLLLGADQAVELPSWREPQEVLALAELAVVDRGGLGPDEVRAGLGAFRGSERLAFFTMPRLDISSSLVRRRASGGLPLDYLVPASVQRMIADRGLYRQAVEAS